MAREGLRRWVEVDSGNMKLMIISKMHKINTPLTFAPIASNPQWEGTGWIKV